MLIQCIECGGTLSDKAHACPHCGFPLTEQEGAGTSTPFDKVDTETAPAEKSRLQKSSKNVASKVAKAVVLITVTLMLSIVYYGLIQIANADIHLRIICNLFLPVFWIPYLSLIRRFYGCKARAIAYKIYLVLVPLGILFEIAELRYPLVLPPVNTGTIVWAAISKLFAFVWVTAVLCKLDDKVYLKEIDMKFPTKR